MIIVGYYYLSYPSEGCADPENAATEMWVEVGREGDTYEHHQGTYSFQVYTFGYVQGEFIGPCRPLMQRSVLIVPTLATEWMDEFLEANLDAVPMLGTLI